MLPKKKNGGGTRYMPMVFTEQRAAMLSCILNSERARIFARMREMLLTHKDILLQLEKIERKLGGYDEQIEPIFLYLKQLLNPAQPKGKELVSEEIMSNKTLYYFLS